MTYLYGSVCSIKIYPTNILDTTMQWSSKNNQLFVGPSIVDIWWVACFAN